MSTSTPSDSSAPELTPARLRALAETGSAPIPSPGERPAIALAGPDESELAGTLLPGVPSTLGLRKFRDRLRQPYVIRTWQHPEGAVVSLRAQRSPVRYHADIPATDAWTYDGCLPGPTIEARSGRSVQIDWGNALLGDDGGEHPHADHREPAPLPYDVVRVPPQGDELTDTIVVANQPGGCVFDEHDHQAAHDPAPNQYPRLEGTDEIRAATVVHLHGALTDGHNDGWAHNVMLPGTPRGVRIRTLRSPRRSGTTTTRWR